MAPPPVTRVIRAGDATKRDPFTICVVGNPALEAPWRSGQFIPDPVTVAQADFDRSTRQIKQVLFGRLPNQAETFLGDPSIGSKVRMITLFAAGLPAEDENSLVGQDGVSSLLVTRRAVFKSFLARYGLAADVVFAVSGSESHNRASAWLTSDDDGGPGLPFTLDGVALHHRFHNLIPGTVALHTTSGSVTALHEFGHALSSYSNGQIVDLYVDSPAAANNKRGRPIPTRFAVYDGINIAADPVRDGIGYPPGWQSYHSALHDPEYPALMDDYWQATGEAAERCQHDQLTRRFLLDRVRAKQSR